MKKISALLSLISVSAFAKIDLDINLQVDRSKMARKFEVSSNQLSYNSQENDLKFEVWGKQEDGVIDLNFSVFKRDHHGNFQLVSQPHIKAEINKPAVLTLIEKKPKEYHRFIQALFNAFNIKPAIVEKSRLKLEVHSKEIAPQPEKKN